MKSQILGTLVYFSSFYFANAAFTSSNRVFVGTPIQVDKRKVEDCMSTRPITVTSSTPVDDAIALLLEKHISGAPVVHDTTGSLIGLISCCDFIQKEAGEGALLPMEGSVEKVGEYVEAARKICGKNVGDMMTSNPITIEPTESMRNAAALMAKHNLQRLPVTENGVLVGMLTSTDIMRDMHRVIKNLPPARDEDLGEDIPMP